MSMSKAKLVQALLSLELYGTESGAIAAWAAAWKEFFSNAFANYNQGVPSNVTDQSINLKIGVNSILGSSDMSGTWVKVECLLTNGYENCLVQYDSQNYIITSDLLGQTAPPSTAIIDYEVTDTAVIVSALTTPEAAMVSAMVGLSVEGEAGNKLEDGITAWWSELYANPSSYFTNATAISVPLGLPGLASDLETSFEENLAEYPLISREDAVDNVADDFIAANTGGTVTISSVVKTIE